MPKRSKIKSIEKMLSLPQCKRPRRKLRHSLKSPERRQKRRLSSLDNGMLSWLKEQSKSRKIKKLLNLQSNRKLLKKKLTERLLRPKRRHKLKLKEFMSKN